MIAYLSHIAVISFFWGVLFLVIYAMKLTLRGE
jgi:hypothetical protein